MGMMFFAGDLIPLPALRPRTARRHVDLDRCISIVWKKYADGEISEDVAARADAILRQEREQQVVMFQSPHRGALGLTPPVWL
jgi:hypothetical protein